MKEAVTSDRIAGVILAGGHARRLGGMPKGTIRAGGQLSLIERLVVHMLRCGGEEIVVAANDAEPYDHLGCAIVPDKRTDAGPLAGIEAALEYLTGKYEAVLCLPCDLPALSAQEMSALLNAYAAHGGPVVFAETQHGARHPLCAVMRTSTLPAISAALDRGVRAVGEVWSELGGTAVPFDNPERFTNINSPDDLDAWFAKQGYPEETR
jgi:molybdopterin-guanine dinucleotide biosynthesis protein A